MKPVQKKEFVNRLESLLHAAGENVQLTLVNDDLITAFFPSGGTKKVNIACDSNLAIIKDVIRQAIE